VTIDARIHGLVTLQRGGEAAWRSSILRLFRELLVSITEFERIVHYTLYYLHMASPEAVLKKTTGIASFKQTAP
jgi:hypothetical protein